MSHRAGGIFRFKCSDPTCEQPPGFEAFVWGDEISGIACPTCGKVGEQLHESRHATAPDQISVAAGIHPNQIPEAMKLFPHHEYTPTGEMVFHGQRHKDRCLKDIGMVEYDNQNDVKHDKRV